MKRNRFKTETAEIKARRTRLIAATLAGIAISVWLTMILVTLFSAAK